MNKISACLIARNAEKTIKQTLKGIYKHVDEIIVVLAGQSTDKTAKIADKWAKVYDYPGDLFEDGSIMSFADARNYSFSKAKYDWLFWIDADDLVENPERLRDFAKAAEEGGYGGVWLPYFYALDTHGNCTTVLERERLLKADLDWKWQGRVHEAAIPSRPAIFFKTADVIIKHQHCAGGSRAERNLRLLYLQLEEEPGNHRTLFYLGNQYFAMEQYDEAVKWFGKFTSIADNPLEKWQAFIYIGKSYIKLKDLAKAEDAYLLAIKVIPEWAESYFGLAEVSAYKSDWDRVLFWTEKGRQSKKAGGYLMINPLDYTTNPILFEEVAYCQKGRVDLALACIEKGLQYVPEHEHFLGKKELYEIELQVAQRAEGLLQYLKPMSDMEVKRVSQSIAPELMKFPEVQDRVGRARFITRPKKDKKIAIVCGQTMEDFSPPAVAKGIGGSETAVVEIAKRFARDDYQVDVYNTPGEYVGLHEGVGYWDCTKVMPDEEYDLAISWRGPHIIPAKKRILWFHDLHIADRLKPEHVDSFDYFLGVSKYHQKMLGRYYPFIPGEKLSYVYNGINLEPFQQVVERNPNKIVYTSSLDRGLSTLLVAWKHIRAGQPEAELYIYYGFNLIDRMIEMGHHDYIPFKQNLVKLMEQEGITFKGRTPKGELVKELLSASFWFYPVNFLEVFCINACEAMAAGLGIVTTAWGALPEVIGDAGLLIEAHPNNYTGSQALLACYYAMLKDKETRDQFTTRAKERAKLFTWNKSYETWKAYIE